MKKLNQPAPKTPLSRSASLALAAAVTAGAAPFGALLREHPYRRRFVWGGTIIAAFFLWLALAGGWLLWFGSLAAGDELIPPAIWLPVSAVLCLVFGGYTL